MRKKSVHAGGLAGDHCQQAEDLSEPAIPERTLWQKCPNLIPVATNHNFDSDFSNWRVNASRLTPVRDSVLAQNYGAQSVELPVDSAVHRVYSGDAGTDSPNIDRPSNHTPPV